MGGRAGRAKPPRRRRRSRRRPVKATPKQQRQRPLPLRSILKIPAARRSMRHGPLPLTPSFGSSKWTPLPLRSQRRHRAIFAKTSRGTQAGNGGALNDAQPKGRPFTATANRGESVLAAATADHAVGPRHGHGAVARQHHNTAPADAPIRLAAPRAAWQFYLSIWEVGGGGSDASGPADNCPWCQRAVMVPGNLPKRQLC